MIPDLFFRPYRKAAAIETVMDELKRNLDVVDACLGLCEGGIVQPLLESHIS
ncbi:hypothetical protein [Acetomicrobium thermoterrenum]|uniref:hypothetical protein n=1 Tax=Acetomicrobium thermoterrenum TaxID=1120986 RepID=UPI001356416C|nr:hypothetical protein [Acetomicrobium thermoterrenum]